MLLVEYNLQIQTSCGHWRSRDIFYKQERYILVYGATSYPWSVMSVAYSILLLSRLTHVAILLLKLRGLAFLFNKNTLSASC